MRAGDIVLVHGNTVYSKFISFGQSLHFKGPNHYKYWTHVAVVVSDEGDIVEAIWPCVAKTHISKYDKIDHAVVSISKWATEDDRQKVVEFALHCVGRHYNAAEIGSLGAYCISGTKFRFGIDNQLICSALGAEALCRTRIIFPEEPLWMFPAHHAQFFGVHGR
jgi:hypothetical protein